MLTGLGKPHWEKSVLAWAGNAPIPISDPRIKAGNMSEVIAALFSWMGRSLPLPRRAARP